MNPLPLTASLLAAALFLPMESHAAQTQPALIDPCPIEMVGAQLPECEPSPPPPPPPPPPPAAPKAVWYTPFSESATVKVRWSPVSGASYYRLNRIASGVTTQVYSGSATTRDVYVGGEGRFQFSVSACNSSGCSGTVSHAPMQVSFGPRGEGAAPQSAKGDGALTMNPPLVPVIGRGYDRLRQDLVPEICLDMTSASVQTLANRAKAFNLSLSKTREEYFRSLNMEENLSVGAKYSSFSGSFSGKKSLASTARRVEDTHILTASFIDRYSTTTITNGATLPFGSTYKGWLLGGLKAHFRNTCGDSYVSSYDTGREVTLTFQMTNEDYTTSETRTKTAEMKIALGNYVSGGYSSTTKTQIETSYSKYGVQVYVYSEGSGASVASVLTLTQALDYLRRFEQEPSVDLISFNFSASDYLRPADVALSLWPDYKSVRTALSRWYKFDNQVGFRCVPFDLPDGTDPADVPLINNALNMNGYARTVSSAEPRLACAYMKTALQENIQYCEDTNKWGQCVQPDSTTCPVAGSSLSCLEHAKTIPLWVDNDSTLTLSRELGSGLFRDCADASGTACLASPSISIVDLRPKFVDCTGDGCPTEKDGVTVETVERHRAENASNSVNASTKCLSASVRVCRPGAWTSGARIRQYQTLHGLQMLPTRDYSF